MHKNFFNKNVLVLVAGTALSQAIPVAISPILTRLYAPEDFGLLALYVAIFNILGSVANARYEQAILLPEKEADAINLTAVSIIISFIFSVMLFIIVFLFNKPITAMLGNNDISIWLYFMPITVFLIGIFTALTQLNVRMKRYKVIATSNVVKSVTLATIQVLVGFIVSGAVGLISGQIVSQAFGNLKLAKTLFEKRFLSVFNRKDCILLLKRYSRFFKYSVWATLLNNLSRNLVQIIISIMYSTKTLGYYSLVERILVTPSAVIGSSISQVFMQQVNEEKNTTGSAKGVFRSTFKKLLLISIIVFGILTFVVEELVALVFGEEWRIVGKYAKIMMPLFFIRFIVSPLTVINNVFEKQNVDFLWQVVYLIIITLIYLILYIFKLSVVDFFYLLSFLVSLYYLMQLVQLYIASKGR